MGKVILQFRSFQLPFFLGASGYKGDGKLLVVSGSVVPLNVEVTVNGFMALVKLEVSVLNVVALAFGELVGSVAPIALPFTLIGDTGLLDLALG